LDDRRQASDLGFGVSLGTRTVLLRSKYWRDGRLPTQPDIIADGLYEAAAAILVL
jgi:hypothetical protein